MMRNEMEMIKLKNFIARTKFYQKIDFGDGIVTNGAFDSKEELKTLRFDDVDFKNKTVLDIGCNAGFFSVEAKRRGAVAVDGIDRNSEQVNKAQHVAQFLHQETGRTMWLARTIRHCILFFCSTSPEIPTYSDAKHHQINKESIDCRN